MSTWLPPTAVEQPEVVLVCWGAFEVLVPELGEPTIHVAGVHATGDEGRVSSPVAKDDGAGRWVVTTTGRVYHLVGGPGLQGDGRYVWTRGLSTWNAKVMTDAAPALIQSFEAGQSPGGNAAS